VYTNHIYKGALWSGFAEAGNVLLPLAFDAKHVNLPRQLGLLGRIHIHSMTAMLLPTLVGHEVRHAARPVAI